MKSRAFRIGVKNDDRFDTTVYAANAGKAKYDVLLRLRDAGWEVSFKDLTCHSLGRMEVPPTPREIAEREAAAFNAAHPVGTVLNYWSGVKEGEPTGRAPISSPASVMCDHAVIWLQGVPSCHSLSHVER